MKKHTVLAVLFTILFAISTIACSIFTVLHFTLYNEGFMREQLKNSNIVAKQIDESFKNTVTGELSKYVETEGMQSTLKQKAQSSIEDIIILSVYHPDEVDNRVNDIKQNVKSKVYEQIPTSNSIEETILKSAVDNAVGSLSNKIEEKMQINKLKNIGRVQQNTKHNVLLILIITAAAAIISLIILIAIKRIKPIVIILLISAVIMGLFALFTYNMSNADLRSTVNINGIEDFTRVLCQSTSKFMAITAAVEMLLAIVIGGISAIANKKQN